MANFKLQIFEQALLKQALTTTIKNSMNMLQKDRKIDLMTWKLFQSQNHLLPLINHKSLSSNKIMIIFHTRQQISMVGHNYPSFLGFLVGLLPEIIFGKKTVSF